MTTQPNWWDLTPGNNGLYGTTPNPALYQNNQYARNEYAPQGQAPQPLGAGWMAGPTNDPTNNLALNSLASLQGQKAGIFTPEAAPNTGGFDKPALAPNPGGFQKTAAPTTNNGTVVNGQTNGTNTAKTGTAGRTGASYSGFLAANPGFDPWTNLDQYAGPNAGNDPILAQAFGWTNQWARDNGFADGSQIPLAQKQQVFLSNLERARQQFADYAVDGQPHPGAITWEQSQASRIPNQGWSYQAGSGLHGGAQPASNNGSAPAPTKTAPAPTTAPTTAPAPTPPATGGKTVADPTTLPSFDANGILQDPNKALPMGTYYQANPGEAANQALASMGIASSNHNAFADTLRAIANQVAPEIANSIGFGANQTGAMDSLKNLPQLLAGLLFGNHGGMYGNLAGMGSQMMNGIGAVNPATGHSYAQGMNTDLVQRLMSVANALRGMGSNEYMQNYRKNALQDQFAQFGNTTAGVVRNGGTLPTGDTLLANDPYGLWGTVPNPSGTNPLGSGGGNRQ